MLLALLLTTVAAATAAAYTLLPHPPACGVSSGTLSWRIEGGLVARVCLVQSVAGNVDQMGQVVRRYRYVSWHQPGARAKGGWVAQVSGITLGKWASEDDAAAAVLKHLGWKDFDKLIIQSGGSISRKKRGSRVQSKNASRAPKPASSNSQAKDVSRVHGVPGVRAYRYVYWHAGRDCWVVRYKDGSFHSPFTSQADAVCHLRRVCQHKGCLLLMSGVEKLWRSSRSPRASKYRRVSWHKPNNCGGGGAWESRVHCTTQRHATELAAANSVVSELGLGSVAELRKSRAERCNAKIMVDRFTVFADLLRDRYPEDLVSAYHHAEKSALMFRNNPALEVLSLQGKYGCWKDALHITWHTSYGDGSRVLGVRDIYLVLEGALRRLHQVNTHIWSINCGRGVSHHSGFIPMLLRIGVLSRTRGVSRNALILGSLQSTYYLVPCAMESRVRSHLLQLLVASAAIFKPAPAPTTCQEWHDRVQAMQQSASTYPTIGLSPTGARYLLPWLIRSKLLCDMHVSRVQGLQVSAGMTTEQFAPAFPDSKDWVGILAKHFQVSRIKDLFEKVGYKDRPELFTYYLCIIGSEELRNYPPDIVQTR